MSFPKRNKLATKMQFSCKTCQKVCSPKEGDWFDGELNQIFLCKGCKPQFSKQIYGSGTSGKSKSVFAHIVSDAVAITALAR